MISGSWFFLVVASWEEGRMENCFLMGIDFQLCKVKKNARVMTKCNLVTSKLHNNVNMVNTAKMYM